VRDPVLYHYFAAETLFELNSVVAARNHFSWLIKSPTFSRLPARMQTEISDRFHELSVRTDQVKPEHLFRCTACDSEYTHMGKFKNVCGDCGTLYETTERTCPACSNDGLVPLQMLVPGR
jgi:hypothetical protein